MMQELTFTKDFINTLCEMNFLGHVLYGILPNENGTTLKGVNHFDLKMA